MSKKLQELKAKKHEYGPQDQSVIDALSLEATQLEAISAMKSTLGWKILGNKIREEVSKEILEAIKENKRIQILLGILTTVETKNATKILEEEIDKLVPN